jgi:hypothetical protein
MHLSCSGESAVGSKSASLLPSDRANISTENGVASRGESRKKAEKSREWVWKVLNLFFSVLGSELKSAVVKIAVLPPEYIFKNVFFLPCKPVGINLFYRFFFFKISSR